MKRRSLRSVARGLGVALSTLQGKIEAGQVTLTDPVDIEAVRAQWIACSAVQGPAPMADRASTPDVSLAEARRRKEHALAQLREIEVQREAGTLLPAKDVEARLVEVFTACKTRLLAIPSRARQQLPHLSAADVGVLEGLVREALEDLAGGDS